LILRWIFEPNTRPCPLENITVITAMTGDEFDDTARDVTNYILPLFRKYRIRFLQVARHGSKEADGITILSDTRNTAFLYYKGDYKLSDELAASGVVPSYSGPHTCSMKSKAVPIETWLSDYYAETHFAHAFGYSAEESKRVPKCDAALVARHVALGFNAQELQRVERASRYDHPLRIGFYPLVEWGWDRQMCLEYVREHFGIEWKKSCCVYCPFAHNKRNLVQLQVRQAAHPIETANALMLEHMSLALNPRGTLYRSESLLTMTAGAGNTAAIEEFESKKRNGKWAIYRVRRIYTAKGEKKGTVHRAVENLEMFLTEREALVCLHDKAACFRWEETTVGAIHYAHVERKGHTYPTREEYFVVAPARVETKSRYGISTFNTLWRPSQFDFSFDSSSRTEGAKSV
jgi:hypothetical protein